MRSFLSLVFVGLASALPAPGQANACAPLQVIIARGTGEPGPYGVIVGDPLVAALKEKLPEAVPYALPYPANADEDSAFIGSNLTVKYLTEQSQACPSQKYAVVGYSQGAAVLHVAALALPKDILEKIIAVVTFGDPGSPGPKTTVPLSEMKNIPEGIFVTSDGKPPKDVKIPPIPAFPEPIASRAKYNCHPGDPVCMPGDDFLNHIEYLEDNWVPDSADFIVGKFKG